MPSEMIWRVIISLLPIRNETPIRHTVHPACLRLGVGSGRIFAEEPEGEVKTAMIRSLAIYMRQQYLIWNKDSVADQTIFSDIEKLSDYRIKVPEGISLSKIADSASFSRPTMSINVGG